jgi:integrase
MSTPFAFSTLIIRYLALKQALGRQYQREQAILGSLDRYLSRTDVQDLTPETFSGWCETQQHLSPTVLRLRMGIIRNLCLYRQRTEPDCFVPDPRLFPPARPYAPPYIFTEGQIARLMRITRAVKPIHRSPLWPQIMRLSITLLYTTGLRRGELLKLTLGDYDPQAQTLRVRESKFHKSRYLPLSLDATQAIETYLRARRAHKLPMAAEMPLLWNGYGEVRSYTGTGLTRGIKVLLRRAQIRTAQGRLPRIHDFRHTFAVHALLRWYRAGADLQAKLPLLSIYMGHISIVSTAYYLPFIERLATAASERFAAYCGALISPMPNCKGGAP